MHDVARKHQLRIARRTLELSDVGAQILGGMTKEEARKILAKDAREKRWCKSMLRPKTEADGST